MVQVSLVKYEFHFVATTRHVFSITKPKVVFCDGGDIEKIQNATVAWKPDIFTLTDHVEGVPSIETLLKPTGSERMYQSVFISLQS